MKTIMLGVIAAAALTASDSAAQAQYYPWCLVISDKTGSWTCYFETREQCLASAGGNVGFCTRNPAAPDPRPHRKPFG
jgi:hypothetical protein